MLKYYLFFLFYYNIDMKLLRLVSDGKDLLTQFTSHIRDNVKINADSKIALKSLSMTLDDKNLIVDNNYFRVKTGTNETGQINFDDAYKNVILQNGTYTHSQLINELTKKLNSTLSSQLYFFQEGDTQSEERTDLGFQWKADLDVGGGLLLSFNRSANDIVQKADVIYNLMEDGEDENTFINANQDPRLNQFESSLLWDDPLCKGGFRAEFNVVSLKNTDKQDDGTKMNYGQFFCGLLPVNYQNTLSIDEFMISCGSTFTTYANNYKSLSFAGNRLIMTSQQEFNTMQIGDYLQLDVWLGNYDCNNMGFASLEVVLTDEADIQNFELLDEVLISCILDDNVGSIVKKELTIVNINVNEGKILLSDTISNIYDAYQITISKKQANPYFRKITDLNNLGGNNYQVELDFIIDPNLDGYVRAQQNLIFYKTMNGAIQFPKNPLTDKPFKMTSGTSFLISRQNLNTDNVPSIVIQLSYETNNETQNFNLFSINIENNDMYLQSFYMGLLVGLDTIADNVDIYQNLYTMYGTIDPFVSVNETTGEVSIIKPKDMPTIHYHKLMAIEPSIVDLNFEANEETKKLLGFKLNSYSVNNVSDKFVAEYPLLQNVIEEDLLVEIQNIPFESYDTSGRKNVIYMMNKGEFESNVLDNRFDSHIIYPIFMGIRNVGEINLNSFNVRISSKNELLKRKDGIPIEMTLLID